MPQNLNTHLSQLEVKFFAIFYAHKIYVWEHLKLFVWYSHKNVR
jgi:hypothetical protein